MMWGLLLSERNLEDLLEVRIHLEVECVGKAAQLRDSNVPKKLQEITDKMSRSFDDHRHFMALDNQFHVLIAQSAGNVLFSTMAETIQDLVRLWYSATYNIPGTMEHTISEHRGIVEAIKRKASDEARAAMRVHLTQAGDRLRTAMS
jgi:GntR family transcriptional repressor for pyruvate dehydrogenase complex